MIRLFKFLFTGDWHLHKWKILETRRLFDQEDGAIMAHGTRYYCQCEYCGIIKKFD